MATTTYQRTNTDSAEQAPPARWLRLIDVSVTPVSDHEVTQITAQAIRARQHLVIANHNLHSMFLSGRDPGMRWFYKSASYVHVDGMAVILLANILGVPLKRIHRATSLDFMPLLFPVMVREGWRLFYLGGAPGVAERGAEALRRKYPGLSIRTQHGYCDQSQTSDVIRSINLFAPHILMVGLGMPTQEKWIQAHHRKLTANVVFPVGAYMDFQASAKKMAPRWLGPFYLEWVYRLVTEPRRLWSRYLVEPWFVLADLIHRAVRCEGSLTEVGSAVFPPSPEKQRRRFSMFAKRRSAREGA